jgi:hypothetical protein
MFKLPDFPSVDFSKFDVPSVDLPTIDVDKLTSAARDLAYLTVGIGAAAVEQAQARSRELATTIADGYEAAKIHVDTAVDKIEAVLPDKVAALLGQAREMSESASNQVLGLIRNAA